MSRIFGLRAFSAAVLVSIVAASANASVLDSLANGINQLEDNDAESLYQPGPVPDFDLNVGDRIYGVIGFQGINPLMGDLSAGDATFSAVFAIEVLARETQATGPGGRARLSFGPLQNGGANSATTQWGTLGLTNLPTPVDNDTMVIVYDNIYPTPNPGAGASENAALLTYVTANPLWEFGFNGAFSGTTGTTSLGEFWQTTGFDQILNVLTVLDGNASNRIALNVTADRNASGSFLGPVTASPFMLPQTQVQLYGVGTFVDPAVQSPGHFGLATDTDFTINYVVPEPMSLVVWGGLAMTAGIVVWRKKSSRIDA